MQRAVWIAQRVNASLTLFHAEKADEHKVAAEQFALLFKADEEETGAPLRPDPREVAAAYRIPVAEIDPGEAGPVETRIPESDRPVLSLRYRDDCIHAPTAAMVWQAIEVAFRGADTRVAHYEQPLFAWR